MRTNYHTHTPRCRHASGREEQYVEAALEQGYAVMGFADHGPWRYASGYVSGIRMLPEDLPGYVRTIRALAERYEGRIEIPLGLEYEYFPKYLGWLKDEAARNHLDYLILGNHFDQSDENGAYFGNSTTRAQMARYVKMTVEGLETGMYSLLAHPDLFLRKKREFDADCRDLSRALCRAAKQLQIPLEYNLLGRRNAIWGMWGNELGYPCAQFWEIAAEEGCLGIIGVDAHSPEQVLDARLYDEAIETFRRLSIRRVERLEFRRPWAPAR